MMYRKCLLITAGTFCFIPEHSIVKGVIAVYSAIVSSTENCSSMKTLYLLRHAKSSWDHPELSDLERPLNERGKRDAPRMGKWLTQHIKAPDLVLCSPSVRTLATISKVGHELGLKGDDYKIDRRLYLASPRTLREIVRAAPDTIETLMLLGHNPGLTEFANQLCPSPGVDNIPTCGIFALRFNCRQWQEAATEHAEFLFFQYPKNL